MSTVYCVRNRINHYSYRFYKTPTDPVFAPKMYQLSLCSLIILFQVSRIIGPQFLFDENAGLNWILTYTSAGEAKNIFFTNPGVSKSVQELVADSEPGLLAYTRVGEAKN